MKKILFEKIYYGFEDIYDMERDISEMWDDNPDIPGEFQGKVKVLITYEEGDEK